MGFWDIAGKVAGFAVDSVKEHMKQVKDANDEMAEKSDDELVSIVKKRGNSIRIAAAAIQLKNRGYDEDEIKLLRLESLRKDS